MVRVLQSEELQAQSVSSDSMWDRSEPVSNFLLIQAGMFPGRAGPTMGRPPKKISPEGLNLIRFWKHGCGMRALRIFHALMRTVRIPRNAWKSLPQFSLMREI